MPEPDLDALRDAMIARAGDLAHWMLRHGVTIEVANGTAPNGNPCCIVIGIGPDAEIAARVAEAVLAAVAERKRAAEAN